jgi:hypothetical protein
LRYWWRDIEAGSSPRSVTVGCEHQQAALGSAGDAPTDFGQNFASAFGVAPLLPCRKAGLGLAFSEDLDVPEYFHAKILTSPAIPVKSGRTDPFYSKTLHIISHQIFKWWPGGGLGDESLMGVKWGQAVPTPGTASPPGRQTHYEKDVRLTFA